MEMAIKYFLANNNMSSSKPMTDFLKKDVLYVLWHYFQLLCSSVFTVKLFGNISHHVLVFPLLTLNLFKKID